MLMQRLIPSLLLKGGRLVKGVRYSDYKDSGRPDTITRAHNAQGADELIVVDIDASSEQRGPDIDAIRRVAEECFMPLTVGGGIRSIDDARNCMAAGADKVMLTTTALDDPRRITDLARVFGDQAVVLGIDVVALNDNWRLFDHRTGEPISGRDYLEWIDECVDRGAGEIRLMSVDREGIRSGMDIELLRTVRERVGVPIILEGGAGSLDHLNEGLEAGADAVACGTLLVFSDNNLFQIKKYLASRGRAMRV